MLSYFTIKQIMIPTLGLVVSNLASIIACISPCFCVQFKTPRDLILKVGHVDDKDTT